MFLNSLAEAKPGALFLAPPLEEIFPEAARSRQIRLFVLRLDKIHPQMGGNKYYKLLDSLQVALAQNYRTLLTFGGAFSNHLYATAAAGKIFGLATLGLVRGEPVMPLNPTLAFAEKAGMQLHYLDRATYRRKNEAGFIEALRNQHGDFFLLPEGGTHPLALGGTARIYQQLPPEVDFVSLPVGTGGTMAGLMTALKNGQKVLGFAVLKNAGFLWGQMQLLLQQHFALVGQTYPPSLSDWMKARATLLLDYHGGGYARVPPALIDFCHQFEQEWQIPIEPVYSGKMFWGLWDLLQKGAFPEGSRIVALHTGGLQNKPA
ncbi:MAG: pyridoxal-phosphate dependent enzyme [Microscillaceae bacterium]|nr:pyridoxal-phosphate dependent enzyme [Microscillaceae bacterium]